MKKFFTFAVVFLMASLSFGAPANFYSLDKNEMQREFVKMEVSQWSGAINEAFESQSDKVIATVLKATELALNSLEKHRAIEVGAELEARCPKITIERKAVNGGDVVYLVLLDKSMGVGFLLPSWYKDSVFTGNTGTVSKGAVKW